MIAILNSSILTTFGNYSYEPISIEEAKLLLQEGYSSYVGHKATNEIIEKLFNIELPYNRTMYNQQIGEKAIVFKLNKRLEEGIVLETIKEIENIGYTIALLIKK
jgi:Domain of unknown function (DUF1874)